MKVHRVLGSKALWDCVGEFFLEAGLRQRHPRGGGPLYSKPGRRCVRRIGDVEAWLKANLHTMTCDFPKGER